MQLLIVRQKWEVRLGVVCSFTDIENKKYPFGGNLMVALQLVEQAWPSRKAGGGGVQGGAEYGSWLSKGVG